MRRHLHATVVGSLLLVGSLMACSGDDDEGGGGDGATSDVAAPNEGGGSDGGTAAAEGDGGGLGLPTGAPLQSGRSIIATAEVTVEVDEVRTGARRAADAAAAAGGFLAHQEADLAAGRATLTLRVPTERFGAVLGELESLGEVRTQGVDTEDVTDQVVDLESRIESARRSVGRVRALLEESGDVTQLATVEGELSRREADLEILLGRQRVLDDQVALATIHVELHEPAAAPDEPEDDPLPGFFGGLRGGWDGFTTSASVVVTGLGYALPFLVLAAVVGSGWLWTRRRLASPSP